MNKKGFTLIELLAVIVILAIIALIAVPIVLNIINDSKEQSTMRSAELYEKAVQNAIMKKQLDGKTIVDGGDYIVMENGNICPSSKYTAAEGIGEDSCSEGEIPVEVEGEIPEVGSILHIGENNTIETSTLNFKTKKVVKDADGKRTISDKGSTPTPQSVALCKANKTLPQALVYSSGNPFQSTSYSEQQVGVLATPGHEYDKGVAYTCNLGDSDDAKGLTFYVLGSNGDNVSLIAGFNLGGTVSWCASGSNNSCNGDGLEPQLAAAKTAWTEITDKTKITVPTKEQIEGAYSGKMPTWLYGNLFSSSAPVGYWTSSPHAGGTNCAWSVGYSGGIVGSNGVDYGDSSGVRPVITISKDSLN